MTCFQTSSDSKNNNPFFVMKGGIGGGGFTSTMQITKPPQRLSPKGVAKSLLWLQ